MSAKQISKEFIASKQLKEAKDPFQFFQRFFNENFHADLRFADEFIYAFVHKSFVNENPDFSKDNERLEFLGDSVLQILISQYLFLKFPKKNEGNLSKLRSALVNEKSLATCARLLNFQNFLILGKGEVKESGHNKDSLLANAFEAYLGALYLSFGLNECDQFLQNLFVSFERKFNKEFIREELIAEFDAKTKLQEIVMKKYKQVPEYKSEVVKVEGKDFFEISLFIDGKCFLTKQYLSKKKGMQLLAKEVLTKEFKIKP